jgi:hypothetical protein
MSTKSSLVAALIGGAIVALAFVLNPSPDQHRAKIKEAIAERNQLAGMFGLGTLAAMASTYHPLGVASYTTVNDRVISVGALGMVFFIQPSQEK